MLPAILAITCILTTYYIFFRSGSKRVNFLLLSILLAIQPHINFTFSSVCLQTFSLCLLWAMKIRLFVHINFQSGPSYSCFIIIFITITNSSVFNMNCWCNLTLTSKALLFPSVLQITHAYLHFTGYEMMILFVLLLIDLL